MAEAGGRLFVDVTQALASPASRAGLLAMAGRSDPLIGDALGTIVDRGDFVPSLPDDLHGAAPAGAPPGPIASDPAIVAALIERSQAAIAALKRDIRTKGGSALLDFILADIQELKRILFDPQSLHVIMAAMEATWWLNERLQALLGEKNAADSLVQSVANNVTSEMGLALLDVADVIRPHPDVVAFLQHVDDESFLDELPKLPGGREARDAIGGWLDKYRHAVCRRDRHHEAALARAAPHARALDPREHHELRAGRGGATLRTRSAGGMEEGTRPAGALADVTGRGA
jgi:pyruvate,water dikinase